MVKIIIYQTINTYAMIYKILAKMSKQMLLGFHHTMKNNIIKSLIHLVLILTIIKAHIYKYHNNLNLKVS